MFTVFWLPVLQFPVSTTYFNIPRSTFDVPPSPLSAVKHPNIGCFFAYYGYLASQLTGIFTNWVYAYDMPVKNHSNVMCKFYLTTRLRIGLFSLIGLVIVSLLIHGESLPIISMADTSRIYLETASNKTYFLEESEDLQNWFPMPTYVVGDGAQKTVPLTPSEKPKNFYRFRVVPTNFEDSNDTDGDGISNSQEIFLQLDPTWINSVSDLAIAEVDSRISGKTPAASLRIFNNYVSNGSNLVFERNADCWIDSIENKSCISPWNSRNTRTRAGTLITPRHVIFCAHHSFFVPAGNKIYFVDDSGVVVERTVLRTKRHPHYNNPYTYDNDIVIGVLDQDVPDSIKCAKFFPDNWNEYLAEKILIPSLRLNQHEEALIGDFYVRSISQEIAYHRKPVEEKRLQFYLSLAVPSKTGLYRGDSGNGGFVVINSQLILTNVWTYGGPGSGTSLFREKSIINTMIHELDTETGDITNHQIEEIDFSRFMKLADIPPENRPVASSDLPEIDESDYPFLDETE